MMNRLYEELKEHWRKSHYLRKDAYGYESYKPEGVLREYLRENTIEASFQDMIDLDTTASPFMREIQCQGFVLLCEQLLNTGGPRHFLQNVIRALLNTQRNEHYRAVSLARLAVLFAFASETELSLQCLSEGIRYSPDEGLKACQRILANELLPIEAVKQAVIPKFVNGETSGVGRSWVVVAYCYFLDGLLDVRVPHSGEVISCLRQIEGVIKNMIALEERLAPIHASHAGETILRTVSVAPVEAGCLAHVLSQLHPEIEISRKYQTKGEFSGPHNISNEHERIVHEDWANFHPNIQTLIIRMDDALTRKDYSGVVHASASIFETLAKEVVNIPTVQDKTLKSFFDRYRKDSNLSDEILDSILAIYEKRNITPLAGHGSTELPNISKEEAITLSEMSKAFVNIEYKARKRDR